MKAKIGKRYRHYKNGKEYIVRSIGLHTETMEEMVVYEGQYTDDEFGQNPLWIRPRKMFEEEVETESGLVDRFSVI